MPLVGKWTKTFIFQIITQNNLHYGQPEAGDQPFDHTWIKLWFRVLYVDLWTKICARLKNIVRPSQVHLKWLTLPSYAHTVFNLHGFAALQHTSHISHVLSSIFSTTSHGNCTFYSVIVLDWTLNLKSDMFVDLTAKLIYHLFMLKSWY